MYESTDSRLLTVVSRHEEPCPYLPGEIARMPLISVSGQLAPGELDQWLDRGYRRCGSYLYRTDCPRCRACQPLRIDVNRFAPRSTQRRVLRRGDCGTTFTIGPPCVDRQRVELFNLHRRVRRLDRNEGDVDQDDYVAFLVDSCCQTWELACHVENRLAAVAIFDRGDVSLSAVYCYYDPGWRGLSLGTYCILKQIELSRRWSLRFVYLGLYIARSPHMSYKARFRPHERLIDGHWRSFGLE